MARHRRTISFSADQLTRSLGVGKPNVWEEMEVERVLVGVSYSSPSSSRFRFLGRVGDGDGGPSVRKTVAKYGCDIPCRPLSMT
jgi:hypothetical protein